ncbi:MAG: hypothetical protein JKY31_01470 [Rhodobacteraceae bacterium]|nr:hypothetical protein [Paracoccaceae bacterium]
MAYRFFTSKLVVICSIVAISLSACDAPSGQSVSAGSVGQSPEEASLRSHSAAMRTTVTEAIALGGAAGLGLRLLAGNSGRSNDALVGNIGAVGFFVIGAGAGAVAGAYIAHLQDNFASSEEQTAALRANLAASISETQATLQVMQVVLANQVRELNRLQAAVNAGSADSASLAREIAEAQANLAEMDGAADGAAGRFNEFTDARNVVAVGLDTRPIDQGLQQLSRQIAEMRGVAENLAGQL